MVLEASGLAAGSWPRHDDSLTLFSPARYSFLPGMPFPGGDRDRYPHRDEVVACLTAYAGHLDAEGNPRRREGLAAGVAGSAFVGLQWQCSLSSNSLRGEARTRSGSPGA